MSDTARREHRLGPTTQAPRRDLARVVPGQPPGTLLPREGPSATVDRVQVIAYTRDRVTETEGKTLAEALAGAGTGIHWINIDGLDTELLREAGARFGLHPLALEDVLTAPQRPKVERYTDHYFLVLRMIRHVHEAHLEDEQVSVFFGRDWVVTIQERPGGDVFDPTRQAIRQARGRVREAGADYLAYLLVDAVVDAFFPTMEAISDRVETLETEALHPSPRTLPRLQRTRRTVLKLRRALWPSREAIAVFQREESPLIAAETRVFLRDSHDHAVQALELVEALRETMADTMEIYLSAQNQRLNEVMKVLTVIATLFIPLTFIASIYGMNFEVMPELRWRWGYPFALGLMAASAAGMLYFFRRKGWW
jgi:magnesium transporter